MTLVELRDRLTDIIEDNEKHEWAERNNSRVVVRHRATKRKVEYRPIRYACSAWLGLGTEDVFEIITEDDYIWRG